MTTETFVQVFFGPGNGITWGSVQDGSLGTEHIAFLHPRIADLGRTERPPVVLPRRVGGEILWYAMAFSDPDFRALRDELLALVGPSFSDFTGIPMTVDPTDAISQAVTDFTGGRAFVLRVPPECRSQARQGFELMRDLRLQRPDRLSQITRPTGRLIREFEFAIESANTELAREILNEIEATGRLGALNLTFLTIQLLDRSQAWYDLITLPGLPDVLQTRRPHRVTEAILAAVYHVELQKYEDGNDPQGALEAFSDRIAPRFASLFRSVAGTVRPEALKCFLLWAALPPQRPDLRDLVGRLAQSLGDDPYRAELARLIPPAEPTPAPTGDVARAALDRGDYDGAFEHLCAAPPSAERARQLIVCAVALDTLQSAEVASATVAKLDAAQRRQLLEDRFIQRFLPAIEVRAAAPHTWTDWIRSLNTDHAGHELLAEAEGNATLWPADAFLRNGSELAELIVKQRPPAAQTVLLDAMPHLLRAMRTAHATPREPSVAAVYEALVIALATGDVVGVAGCDVLHDLVADLLEAGVTAQQYGDYVTYLSEVWEREQSPRLLGWLIELLETLAFYPTPVPEVRDRLVSQAIVSVGRWARFIDTTTQDVLVDLFREFGIDPIPPAQASEPTPSSQPRPTAAPNLDHLVVGLYTLAPGVGARVKRILESRYQGLEVRLSDAEVGTDGLQALAAHADVMIMVTKSATHAATQFINQHAGTAVPILYPSGKGSSSAIAAFEAYLHEAGVAA